jgi:hypothetical protein
VGGAGNAGALSGGHERGGDDRNPRAGTRLGRGEQGGWDTQPIRLTAEQPDKAGDERGEEANGSDSRGRVAVALSKRRLPGVGRGAGSGAPSGPVRTVTDLQSTLTGRYAGARAQARRVCGPRRLTSSGRI